jgi:hypothetical protein
MSERTVEWIIANAINEQARGDPDALAAEIIAALERAGYRITPEDTALGSQPFDELTPDMRPQDIYGDGCDWEFETSEHGGDEPDNMPQAITATDPAGTLGGLCPAHPWRQDRDAAAALRGGHKPAARLMTIRSSNEASAVRQIMACPLEPRSSVSIWRYQGSLARSALIAPTMVGC